MAEKELPSKQEVEFVEDYVLATERLKTVAEMYDDDAQDYWYWSMLNVHVTEMKAKDKKEKKVAAKAVDQYFGEGAEKVGEDPNIQDLLFRQHLRDYDKNNYAEVCERLQEICDSSRFDHTQDAEIVDVKGPDYPTTLQLSSMKLLNQKFKNLDRPLSEVFKSTAAEFLASQAKNMTSDQRSEFLELIADEYPSIPGLLDIIIMDLEEGTIFGQRKIHDKLTLAQMKKLTERIRGTKDNPGILGDESFLITFCCKLRPVTDANLTEDGDLMQQYLEGLLEFALNQMDDNHATLKALILFNYLKFRESRGDGYRKNVIKQYLAIPKTNNIYLPENSRMGNDNPQEAVDFNIQYEQLPELPKIEDDEPLIRRALSTFFLDGDKTDAWTNYLHRHDYSLPLWAESMLVMGRGNQQFQEAQRKQYEKSYSIPGAYKRLVDRVELQFCPDNNSHFAVDDTVVLKYWTKNNTSIDFVVYDVNAKNYYKEKLHEVPKDLRLHGSFPMYKHSQSCEAQSPIRRVQDSLELECLKGRRGVFIVDMVGNGVTCRALIHKGELRYIYDQVKNSTDGYVFKVFNERNEMVKNPKIWMAGQEYFSDANGDVQIPYAEGETVEEQLIILEDSDEIGSTTLQAFRREAPKYRMSCGLFIDREQLLKKKQAKVIIRASLYMNHDIISLSNLNDVQFKLTLVDNSGEKKTRIEDINLYDDKETIFSFTVPTELRTVMCVLTSNVVGQLMISKQKIDVNASDDTLGLANMYCFPMGKAGYVLAVLGKNGEGYKNVPLTVSFKHKSFCEDIVEQVMTDDHGRVYLGNLPDVTTIDVTCNEPFVCGEASFETLMDVVNVPNVVHRTAKTLVKLPFTPANTQQKPNLYLFDSQYIKEFSQNARYNEGYITISGLGRGDYHLYIRDQKSTIITIRIGEGAEVSNESGEYVICESRVLQLSEDTPLQIISVEGDRKQGFNIKLDGVNELTRVHVIASTNNPIFNLYGFLASPFCPPNKSDFEQPETCYVPKQNLEEDYKYVVNRKHEEKYLGNLLGRPSMLSNAFTSEAEPKRSQDPRNANDISRSSAGAKDQASQEKFQNTGSAHKHTEEDPAPLEFLGESSFMYANRVVRDNVVNITADLISPSHNLLQILAVDDDNTCLKYIQLEEPSEDADVRTTDTRLDAALAPESHFTEVRRIICLPSNGDSYVIEDFSTAEYEPYETLEEPFNLYRSLAGTALDDKAKAHFMEFEPLVQWTDLTLRERLNFYDKFACHEVNLFLNLRDEEFFQTVIAPNLQNKIQKTFIDKYLLGMDLVEYTKPWKSQKLNALEQILLAYSLRNDELTYVTLRNMTEKAELGEVNPKEQDRVFDLAIKSRELGVEELEKAQQMLEAEIAEQQFRQRADSKKKAEVYATAPGMGDYIDQTCAYQETGYYRVPVTSQRKELIPCTRFWKDYADFMLDPSKKADGFVSQWFCDATSNINEMLAALAVLGVPLEAEEPKRFHMEDSSKVEVRATKPVILFVRELVSTEIRTSALSLSQNYFDPLERQHFVDGEKVDKFITSFKTKKVYGCRLVVTNVSSVEQRVEILSQIPAGAIPCGESCYQTKNWVQVVAPYGTYRRAFYFYWPSPGTFHHYPTHVNKNGETIGYSKDKVELVVETGLVEPDTSSWRYIANIAEEQTVLEYLSQSEMVHTVELSKICWRFQGNTSFFDSVCKILRNRRVFNEEIWAYSLVLDQGRANQEIGEFLSQNANFREYIYPGIKSKAVTAEFACTRDYQITEFWPLMNPRAHDVVFSHVEFQQYYSEFLRKVAFSSSSINDINIKDKLCLTNYLLIRNRIQKALTLFKTIKKEAARKHYKMVYDYLYTYLSFFKDDKGPNKKQALQLVKKEYEKASLPLSLKELWNNVQQQLGEAEASSLSDSIFLKAEVARERKEKEPALDFFPQEGGVIVIEHQNIKNIKVSFYRTELELMFSMYPFQDENVSYKLMLPNIHHMLEVDHNGTTEIELPAKLRGENTIVVMSSMQDGKELKTTKVAYDNNLTVNIATEKGELRVLDLKKNTPIASAYVKVYAQNIHNNTHSFFKDGYTDVRGRFDFRGLSTDQLRSSKRLAILIATEDNGSVIQEVEIPNHLLTRANLFDGPSFQLRSVRGNTAKNAKAFSRA